MIITKLCIILVIFAKHCDSLSTCRQLLYFTTAGHAMYLLCLSPRRGDSSDWSLVWRGPVRGLSQAGASLSRVSGDHLTLTPRLLSNSIIIQI